MSSHPEMHAELEQLAHLRAESEDAMRRGMSQAEREEYWRRQAEFDALMESDTGTIEDMVALLDAND